MSEYKSAHTNRIKVHFYKNVADEKLKFAVIAARYKNKWVFCKHKERNTYEIPGGHREFGEMIDDTAKRELYEETGAINFELIKICVYSVECTADRSETFGMLYLAEIKELEPELKNEIEQIEFFDDLPKELTYPLIQPFLFQQACCYKQNRKQYK